MTFLYQPVSKYDVFDAFRRMGGNFTYDAINALVEYYHELAIDLDEPIEFDVIAWCCDWDEYPNFWEAFEDQYLDPSDREEWATLDEDEQDDKALEYFQENTAVIEFDGGVLVQSF